MPFSALYFCITKHKKTINTMSYRKKHPLTMGKIVIGLVAGVLVGSLIPDNYNVLTIIKKLSIKTTV